MSKHEVLTGYCGCCVSDAVARFDRLIRGGSVAWPMSGPRWRFGGRPQ